VALFEFELLGGEVTVCARPESARGNRVLELMATAADVDEYKGPVGAANDVEWLDVAVDNGVAIPEVVNRGGEIRGQRKGIAGVIFLGSIGERLTSNEFLAEPDVVLAGDLVLADLGVEDASQVGVVEGAANRDLALGSFELVAGH